MRTYCGKKIKCKYLSLSKNSIFYLSFYLSIFLLDNFKTFPFYCWWWNDLQIFMTVAVLWGRCCLFWFPFMELFHKVCGVVQRKNIVMVLSLVLHLQEVVHEHTAMKKLTQFCLVVYRFCDGLNPRTNFFTHGDLTFRWMYGPYYGKWSLLSAL